MTVTIYHLPLQMKGLLLALAAAYLACIQKRLGRGRVILVALQKGRILGITIARLQSGVSTRKCFSVCKGI